MTIPCTRASIGLQLYTLREAAQKDLIGTLERVAAIGYRAVEFAGLMGLPAREVRAALDRLEMTAAAAHVPLSRWENEPDVVLDELRILGCQYGVVPWVEPARRNPLAQAERVVASVVAAGEASARRGIPLAYHHHDFEFFPLEGGNGVTLWDLLVERTDPAQVQLELDLYWAHVGGQDPLALLRQYAGRVPLIHVKDAGADLSDRGIPRDLPAGSGILDWPALLAAAEEGGARWYIVEQDNPNPADPAGDVAAAWNYLTR
ncbi:MAG: sugar phosphate isomerase/epimerase family protein [Thermomicrobiales bacterium]